MKLKPLLALIVLLTAGCAGFREAYEERVLHKITGEQEFIHLGCKLPLDKKEALSGQPSVLMAIGEVADSRPYKEYIGGMFDRPTMPVPVSVGAAMFVLPFPMGRKSINLRLDGKIEDVLSGDIIRILEQASYTVAKGPDGKEGPPLSLNIEMLDAWVESYAAEGMELKGPLKAGIAFRLALVRSKTREILWSKEFYGVEETRIGYSLKSYHEESLNKAYCKALASVAEMVNSKVLDEAVRGK